MAYTIPFYDCCFMEGFGGSRNHRGVDVAPGGNMFPSWVNGVVVTAGYQSCLGNRVVVRNDVDGYYIGVSHLANIQVSVGQRVSIGTGLGNIGNTGSCSQGRHAHITVSPSSQYPESGAVMNPVSYASSGSGGGGTGGYAFGLSVEAVTAMQKALTKLGLYSGPADGAAGPLTVTGMQVFLRNGGFVPAGYTADGEPGPVYGEGLQKLAAKHGYTGPIDGNPGPATSTGIIAWANSVLSTTPPVPQPADWAAWQTFLKGYGYEGPVDGQPGTNTYMALQRFLAEKFGYAGPIDGDPGPKTWEAFDAAVAHGYPGSVTPPPPAIDWKAWQTFLAASWGYDGPIDGEPGTNTYLALQKFLAASFAYTGPIDGEPGDFTWAAFNRAVAAGYPTSGTTPVPPEPQLPLPGSFMIDVAKYQWPINYGEVKAALVQAVVVKASGFNITPMYVADNYHDHVDAIRTAGLFLGHYYVTGKTSTGTSAAAQAKFFVDNLYGFNVAEDIVMLDNEKLDSNGEFWLVTDILAWVDEVHALTGIPYERIWVYGGASDWRAHGPWDALTALPVRIVWAAYGDYPTGPRPDHVPALQGKISRWDVHQFTSRFRVAGKDVDAMHSPWLISELFGVGATVPPDPCPPCPDCPPSDREAILDDMQLVIDEYRAV